MSAYAHDSHSVWLQINCSFFRNIAVLAVCCTIPCPICFLKYNIVGLALATDVVNPNRQRDGLLRGARKNIGSLPAAGANSAGCLHGKAVHKASSGLFQFVFRKRFAYLYETPEPVRPYILENTSFLNRISTHRHF